MNFNFCDDDPRSLHIEKELQRRGCKTRDHDGFCVSFMEDMLPTNSLNNGWITHDEAALWTCKNLYYSRLGIEHLMWKNRFEKISIPWDDFIIKPTPSHEISAKTRRGSTRQVVDFLAKNNHEWNGIDGFIIQPKIKHDESVWIFTLWDSRGVPGHLWFSTEKEHGVRHRLEETLLRECGRIGIELGLKRWMTFMEFLVLGDQAWFIDLNPRLPGDDDWHELVYAHLTGRSLGADIATMMLDDALPPCVKSENVVLESEWDGKPISENQRLWEYGDGYKQKPVLTFTKK